ncbi:MAG TPA: PAAR domain-containing protein [Chloroflexota bacterium]|nr:PAAR domain-containing protein [Chloroflexota bacterium]
MPGPPAAKEGDRVVATDTHIVLVPSPGGPVPTPLPHSFSGIIDGGTSPNVKIMGRPAATAGSRATNTPPHTPEGGGSFQNPPTNKATIIHGSSTVLINNKPAARNGDTAITCNDPFPLPVGKVVATGTVFIGG